MQATEATVARAILIHMLFTPTLNVMQANTQLDCVRVFPLQCLANMPVASLQFTTAMKFSAPCFYAIIT